MAQTIDPEIFSNSRKLLKPDLFSKVNHVVRGHEDSELIKAEVYFTKEEYRLFLEVQKRKLGVKDIDSAQDIISNDNTHVDDQHTTSSTPPSIKPQRQTLQKKISSFFKPISNIVTPLIHEILVMTFAAIVFAFTQSGKTGYVFKLLAEKLRPENRNLVIILTQSNTKECVAQTVQRAKHNEHILTLMDASNIYANIPDIERIIDGKSYMLVAFNHKDKRRMLVNFVARNKHIFDTVTVVIDECDQGGSGCNKGIPSGGVFDRLKFVQSIEDAFTKRPNVIFVTATIANMSKCIATIVSKDAQSAEFPEGGIVQSILRDPILEQHFVTPHPDYVRASMYLTSGSLGFLRYTKECGLSEYEYLLGEITNIPLEFKKLSLITTTHLTKEHDSLAKDLLTKCAYNVVVVMNSEHHKDYIVYYTSTLDDSLKAWTIHSNKINALANKKMFLEIEVESEHDLNMTHILQSALLMNTDYAPRPTFYLNDPEKKRRAQNEYKKVCALFEHLDRPCDYPSENTKVAMVAGHLASRGITFQNPMTGFVCTSFCVKGTNNSDQRGAENTQRIGRTCGELMKTYRQKGGVMPYMLCSEGVYMDTLANEETIETNMGDSSEHQLIALKDMVTEEMWQKSIRNARRCVRELRPVCLDEQERFMFKEYLNIEMYVSRCHQRHYFTRDDIREYSGNIYNGKTVAQIEEQGHRRRYLEKFEKHGFIVSTKVQGRFHNVFTQKGKEHV